jgi:hypothetical protein
MSTTCTTSTFAGLAAAVLLLGGASLVAGDPPAPAASLQHGSQQHEQHEEEGYAAAKARVQEPDAIEAAFPLESYRPETTATLRLWTGVRGATIRIFRVGPEPQLTVGDKTMEGVPVTPSRRFASLRPGSTLAIPLGDWPSGLYFAKLTAPGKTGFAPFVVRPARLGVSRVAVVLPTRTWQAYNFRDDDADGRSDTWYAMQGQQHARLGRPFLNRGVPPHFRRYDLRFLRWLHRTGRQVDVLSQAELDGATGAGLARAYDLIVFPGHHEYVTRGEYDAVEGFRDRGGNLIFLSANNFFWRIDLKGRAIVRVAKWRDLGRPEASLLGVQYSGNDRGEHRAPWLVRPAAASSWIFRGVELGPRNAFSTARIEIDAVAPSSPRGTMVLADAPDLLGPGMTAQMTYYETERGAKVFSAGAFTLAGSIREPGVQRLLANLWERLARVKGTSEAGLRPAIGLPKGDSLPAGTLRGLAHTLQQYPTVELASDVERAEAERLLAEMEAAVEPWRDPAVAAAAGFDTRRPKRAAEDTSTMWLHAESRDYHHDVAYLDPARPDTLIYADMPGRPLVLVGVMFSMPRGLEGSSPGGPITRWHWHNVCASAVKRGLKPRSDGSCPAGTSLHGGSEMLHAWFTGDLRSAYAIHAPVHELCTAGALPAATCDHGAHGHGSM